MFSNKSFDVVGFDSCWKTERSTESAEVQTVPCSYDEKESQAVTSHSVEIQTESTSTATDVDYNKLATFLKRICPSVLTELDKIEKGRSINQLETEDDVFEETKLLHVIQPTKENEQILKMKVSSVSWSCCGGSLLAFGFCCLKHESWCDHSSQAVLYNINRQDVSLNTPANTLETSSCVTIVSFHPFEPAILAVGMFSGEILVWNLQKDGDSVLGTSASVPGAHRDAVTQMLWIPSLDPAQHSWSLISAGRDGQILIWQVAPRTAVFRLQEGFAISLEHGVHGGKVRTPMGGGLDHELGVICISFSSEERSTFIAGVEGGGLLKCSLLTNKPAAVTSAIPLKDPVLSSFEGHQGSVTSVQCSTAKDQTFVSCGIDKEIHVYHFDQTSPLKVIFTDTLYVGLAWCPSNNRLLSAWGERGTVDFYSLLKGEEIPSLKLDSNDGEAITTVNFNAQRPLLRVYKSNNTSIKEKIQLHYV